MLILPNMPIYLFSKIYFDFAKHATDKSGEYLARAEGRSCMSYILTAAISACYYIKPNSCVCQKVTEILKLLTCVYCFIPV